MMESLIAMNNGQIRFFMLLAYMGLLLFLGYFASRMFSGTKKDYLLASHSIGPWLLLMSLFGTTMTAFALVGSSGEAYKKGIGVYGMLASSSGIIHSLCFFVIGVKIYRFGRKFGYSTQIQFFRDRLESDSIGLLLFPILVGLIIPYLLIGVIAGGGVISVMTAGAFPGVFSEGGEIPAAYGALLICGVVLTYVFFGGMRGTAWANAFQTTVFMVLGVVTFYLLAMKMGKGDSLADSIRNLNTRVDLFKASRVEISPTVFFTYMFIPLSVGMFPHLFQHWLTAKSVNSFKLPVVMHPIFIMIVWVPCVLIGVWATTMVPALTVSPNKVLATLVNTQIGPIMGGLLSAGILAAIMSSLDSQFLCVGSMFTNDVVTHYLGKDRFSDRQQVWIARLFIIGIVGVTYFLSLQDSSRSVFAMAIWCFSGFAGLFPIVFAALYWKRLTAAGAMSGVLAMLGSWLYLFKESMWGKNDSFHVNLVSEKLLGVALPVMPVVVIFICTTVAMVITSFLTKPPSEATIQKFFGPQEK